MSQQRQRRRAEADLSTPTESSGGDATPERSRFDHRHTTNNIRGPRRSAIQRYIDFFGIFITLGILVLVGMLIWEVVLPTRQLRIYYGTLGVSLVPVVIAAYTIFRPNKPLHQRVTPFVMVATIISGVLPSWISAGMAAVLLFLFGWATRPANSSPSDDEVDKINHSVKRKSSDNELERKDLSDGSDKRRHKFGSGQLTKQAQHNLTKAAGCAVLMTITMLTENFFIWVVSATFEKGWNPRTAPDPLHDNGQRILTSLLTNTLELSRQEVISLRRIWNVQYGLVASLGTGLILADFHSTRQLWSLGSRALLTLASARFLRTVSFLLTVLPSQNKYCFGQHYPNPPPDNWSDWFMVGLQPNSHGGCNDLIVSGHATVTSTIACVALSLAEDPLFGFALWWLLAMDYSVEIYEGFHYSVDMWLGAVLCALLWRVWKPIEDNNTERNETTLQDMLQRFQHDSLTINDCVKFGVPAALAFLQVTMFPESWANFLIVAFTTWGISHIVMYGFQQYTKHIFYCSLFIGIGTYL